MKLKELSLFTNIARNNKSLKRFSDKPCTVFSTKHSCVFFKSLLNDSGMKYFHITDTTKQRLSNVPTEEISGAKLIDLKSKPQSGLVFFNDGLHFIYLIRGNGVYIMTSRQKSKKFVDDHSFYTSGIMSGFLYYDFFSDGKCCYINNILDTFNNSDHLLHKESSMLPLLKKMKKECEIGKLDLFNKYKEDFAQRNKDTKLCLQAFMFIHFAKVFNTSRISEECDTIKFSEKLTNKEIKMVDIIQVDTLYDETMTVINPFSVTGHYRNQPIGLGRSETKLIYIDGFMKSGYTRIATKDKCNI